MPPMWDRTAALPDGAVHVWYAWLHVATAARQRLADTLSLDERARAERFHFSRHRDRYIVGRGLLRLLLSRYVGLRPQQVAFTYGAAGKPALRDSPVHFNVSHSEDLAVYAFAPEVRLGVDIEKIRSMSDDEGIAKRFFSAAEYAEFLTLDHHERPRGFFNCWTRKEAYVKALGDGLQVPLDRFRVTMKPGEPALLVSIEDDPNRASPWSVLELTPADGYVGAVVVYGRDWQFCRRWLGGEADGCAAG